MKNKRVCSIVSDFFVHCVLINLKNTLFMKKITLFLFSMCLAVFTWQGNAQFTFPPAGPVNVPGGVAGTQTVSINDAANSAGVPAGTYPNFIITVSWSDTGFGDTAWSIEAGVDVVTAEGTVLVGPPPTSGGANSSASTTLTFSGNFAGSGYDPTVDGTFDLVLYQDYTNSEAIWDNITVQIIPSMEAPECATAPITPADAETGVDADGFTLSWTAPASGPAPTSYNIYVGTDPGTLELVFEGVEETEIEVTAGYDTTYYWQVRPVNINTEATGCPVWSFTTDICTICPANDDCGNATSIVQETGIVTAAEATPTAGTIENATNSGLPAETCAGWTGTANDDVWYSFVALTETVNITYEATGTAFDMVIQLYSGVCGSLVVEDCADATVTTPPIVEEIQATGLTVGDTYYTRIYQYGTATTTGKSFNVKIWSPEILSVDDFNNNGFTYFPNPVKNTLQLNAQSNIQNVSVFNILGQEVLRTAPNRIDSELDMSSLQTGAYFVKVTINDRTETVRVIKQ